MNPAKPLISRALIRHREQVWPSIMETSTPTKTAAHHSGVPGKAVGRQPPVPVIARRTRNRASTAEWISRQVTEAFPWDYAPRYLIRDRDTSYGSVFLQRIRAMGIRDHPIAPQSPWQNADVERLIGSTRRECLDHMIVFGEAHLRRILRGYAAYYNVSRTHRSLNKDAPLHRAIERLGAVVSRPVLGGLHHQYCRI